MNRDLFLTWLGRLVVGAALIASWLVTFEVRSSFQDFRSLTYSNCVARSTYDANQLMIDAAIQSYYQDLESNIHANTHHSEFYRQLELRAEQVLSTLDTVLEAGEPATSRDCLLYK